MDTMRRIPRRWLFALTISLTLLLALIPAFWVTRGALASGASLTLSPTSGLAGAQVSVAGSDYRHKESVSVTFDGAQVASATTSSNGAFSASFAVPQSAASGAHTVTAAGVKFGDSASASFQVFSPTPTPTPPPPPPPTGTWLGFGNGPQGGRSNPNETGLSASNVAQLTLDWSNSLGGPDTSYTIVNGVLYADTESAVNALNAATGAELWSSSTMGGGSTTSSYQTPSVDNGMVYANGASDVFAFDAQTGATRWTFATGSSILSSPTATNGTVYVTARGGTVYALNGATGAVIWSVQIAANDLINQTPAVANGAVYFVSQNGVAYALSASTGATLWQTTIGDQGPTVNMPVVDNGVVFMVAGAPYPSTQGEVVALDATTGAIKWVGLTPFYGTNGLALANGMVYAAVINSGVYAFDEATGALKWSVAITVGEAAPAVANGVLYIGTGTSYLSAFDASTGAALVTVGNCGTNPYASPAIAQGVVYTGCGFSIGAFHLPGTTP